MSDDGNAPKKQKLAVSAGNQNDIAEAGPSNQQPTPASPPPDIFKLTADCCDEIFEYLSLKDLHSFGRTCKTFNKVAGEYFKRNYSAIYFDINDQGIYTQENWETINLSGFNPYATKVTCIYSDMCLLKRSDEFTSIKNLKCSCINVQDELIQKIFPKIECLNINDDFPTTTTRSIDYLLQPCSNLKSLSLQLLRMVRYKHEWLHRVYPNLIQMKLNRLPSMVHLKAFFELNPNIRSLSVQFNDFYVKRDSFLNSEATQIKMDLFEVKKMGEPLPEKIELLNEMYERGIYKRLHLKITESINQEFVNKLHTLKGLDKLTVEYIPKNTNLSPLTQLKRLDLVSFIFANVDEMEILANALVNLERISLRKIPYNDILPLFRRSANLKKMSVCFSGKCEVMNLSMLNKEREKLPGATKLIIYVEDAVYLPTKWATENGDTNLSLVEMRRRSSIEWNKF